MGRRSLGFTRPDPRKRARLPCGVDDRITIFFNRQRRGEKTRLLGADPPVPDGLRELHGRAVTDFFHTVPSKHHPLYHSTPRLAAWPDA